MVRAMIAVMLLLVAGCGAAAPEQDPVKEIVVSVKEYQNGPERKLTTWVYEPAEAAKAPVVLFIHGLAGMPEDHESMFGTWARAGYLVVAPKMPRSARDFSPPDVEDLVNQPADASAVLTQALKELGDKADPSKIVGAGFSLGGMTAVGLFTRHRDDRLMAGIVMAGADRSFGHDYQGTPVPILFIHGRKDTTVTYWQGMQAYEPLTWPKVLLDLPEGNHRSPYLTVGGYEYKLVEAATVHYLNWIVRGDEAARAQLAAISGVTITS
jgi:dienelactone hydrolase